MSDTRPSDHVRLEVAFTTDPDSDSPAFQDVTSRVDLTEPTQITRGRGDEFSQPQPGHGEVTVNNYDGALTMGRAASPYYPNVVPGKRLRVTYRDPATAGNLLTDNQASIETSSNDYTTTSAFGYIGGATKVRSSTHALDGTWALHVTWPTTGGGNTAIEYTPVSGLVVGRTYIWSLSVWVPTGSPGVRADVLLTAVSATSTTFDNWQRLSVTFTAAQETHYCGVSVVGSTSGNDVWVDALMLDEGTTLNTFTLADAPIEYRFDGYVEKWPTVWPGGGSYSQATISAVDLLARLGGKRRLRSVVSETIILGSVADILRFYYPLGEPEGATTAGDITGTNGVPLTIQAEGGGGTGTLTFGTGTGPGTDSAPAPQFAPQSSTVGYYLHGTGLPVLGGYFNVTLRASFATTGTNENVVALADIYRSFVKIYVDGSGLVKAKMFDTWGGVDGFTITGPSVNDGGTKNYALTLSQSGGTISGKLWNGDTQVGSTGTYSSPFLPLLTELFVGTSPASFGGLDSLFTGTISHVAAWNTALTSTELGNQATAASTGFEGESTDARIARICSWVALSTARQMLEAGETTSMAFVDYTGKSPLEALQSVAETEQGILYADARGRLVFHNRTHFYMVPTATSSVDANLLGREAQIIGDTFGILNDVTGSRPGGATQRYTDEASRAANGTMSNSYELGVTSDAEVTSAIQWAVNTHKTPVPRLEGAAVDAYTDPSEAPSLRALDVDTRLDVTGLPAQAPVATMVLRVNGYTERVGQGVWDIEPTTSNYANVQALILNDATYGKTDSTNVLVY